MSARSAYKAFHGREPRRTVRVRMHGIPREGFELGPLHSVVYEWSDGELYEHEFPRRPVLASSADGRQLLIVGGSYLVRPNGIVG